jgi:hypothetical protein
MAENEKSKTAQLPMMQQQQRLPASSSSSTTCTSSPSNGSEHDQGYSGDYYSSWSEGSHCGSHGSHGSSSCSSSNGASHKNKEHTCGPVVSRRSSGGNDHSRSIRKSDTHHPTNERSRTTCMVSGTSSTQYGTSIDLALVQAVSASAAAAAAAAAASCAAESSWPPPPRANTNTLITTATAAPVEAAYHGLMEVSARAAPHIQSWIYSPNDAQSLFSIVTLAFCSMGLIVASVLLCLGGSTLFSTTGSLHRHRCRRHRCCHCASKWSVVAGP